MLSDRSRSRLLPCLALIDSVITALRKTADRGDLITLMEAIAHEFGAATTR